MTIKLEVEEVAKIKEFLMAKTEIYAQVKELQHYAENFAIGIWQEQKKLEEKYKVDFASKKHQLDLVKNEIIEVEETPKIIT
jgi:hypothetical protein